MSKKKKRRTRKEKERAKLHREKYLDKYTKMGSDEIRADETLQNIESKSVQPDIAKLGSSETLIEAQYIASDTKRSVIAAILFLVIIIALYFLEQKFNYFGPLANKLISFLIQ